MYLTKREQAMCKAKQQGEEDYDSQKPYNEAQYGDDDGLKISYRQGWNVAKADTERFWEL